MAQITQMNTAQLWCNSMATLVLVGCVSSQTLVTECVHRDSTGRVIYLEREYLTADTTLYYCAYSNGGRLQKQWSTFVGDTVVESFQCYDLTARLYPDHEGDEWVISESLDSVWVSLSDGGIVVWDSVLPFKEGKAFLALKGRHEGEYAALVHDEAIPIKLEEAKLRETWEYHTLIGLPTRFYVYGRKGQLTNRQYFKVQGDTLVALSFFGIDPLPYAVDTITWDTDTNAIRVVKQRLDLGERYYYSLQLNQDSSVLVSGEGRVANEWVYDRPQWHVRLREATQGEGPLCSSKIARMRVSLPRKSCSSKGSCTVSEHDWDQNGNLAGSMISRNGRFERLITYSYP